MQRHRCRRAHPGGHNPGLTQAGKIGGNYYPGVNIDDTDPRRDLHNLAQLVQISGPGDTSEDPGRDNYGPWETGVKELYEMLKDRR